MLKININKKHKFIEFRLKFDRLNREKLKMNKISDNTTLKEFNIEKEKLKEENQKGTFLII